jgi:hypothetical protein
MRDFVPFSLKVNYSDEDVFRFAKYLQNRSVLSRYSWLFVPASVALCILLVLRSMSYPTDQTNYLSVAFISVFPALILCIAILFSKRFADPWLINRRIRKIRATVPGFGEIVTFNFTGEYVESATSLNSSKFLWRSFTRAVELEDSFLFSAGALNVFFIPKRPIQNEQADQLRELLREKDLMT